MNAVETIEKALKAGVLLQDMVRVPLRGASEVEIDAEEALVGQKFSLALRVLLRRWNGINLDVLRFYGCQGTITLQVHKAQLALLREKQLLCIGSDPAGFVYCEDQSGRVFSFDRDGGAILQKAVCLDDFVSRFVFGSDAGLFAGPDWARDLNNAGLGESLQTGKE
jgi:hypothetical protein